MAHQKQPKEVRYYSFCIRMRNEHKGKISEEVIKTLFECRENMRIIKKKEEYQRKPEERNKRDKLSDEIKEEIKKLNYTNKNFCTLKSLYNLNNTGAIEYLKNKTKYENLKKELNKLNS